jgi:hypothetical protein
MYKILTYDFLCMFMLERKTPRRKATSKATVQEGAPVQEPSIVMQGSASQPTGPHVSTSQPTMPHVSASQPPMNTEPVQGPSRHIAKVVYHNSHPERPFKIQKVASSNATNTVPKTIVTDFYDAPPASQIDSGLGPDVFDDLDNHVLAAITDQMFEAVENKFKTVNGVKNLKQQKVKTLGLKKSVKPKSCRKSSTLMKL